MSLNIGYYTNGINNVYLVKNSGVTPIYYEVFKNRNDIPIEIRHYAKKKNPKYVSRELAYQLGIGYELYPE